MEATNVRSVLTINLYLLKWDYNKLRYYTNCQSQVTNNKK